MMLELTQADIASIDWYGLSSTMSADTIFKNRDRFPWDWHGVSENQSLTIDHVVANSSLPWNWSELAAGDNNSIKIQDIMNHPTLPWDWLYVSSRRDLTREIVQANYTLPWNYHTSELA